MKKTAILLFLTSIFGVFACSTTRAVAQEQQEQSTGQVQQVKTSGVQGNITELSGVLGEAKAYVVDLEENGKNTIMLRLTIDQATKAIQEVKDLLDKYDYPNERQIQQQLMTLNRGYLPLL